MPKTTPYLDKLALEQRKSKAEILVDTLNQTRTQYEAAEKLQVSQAYVAKKLVAWNIETRYHLKTKNAS